MISQSGKSQLYNISLFLLSFFSVAKDIYVIENGILFYVLDALEWVFLAILIMVYLMQRYYNTKELLIECIVVLILLVGYIQSGYAVLLRGALLIVAAKGIDFIKICRTLRYGFTSGFYMSIGLYVLGVSRVEDVRRGYSSLGFSYPNVCSGVLLIICILWIIERARRKVGLTECVLCWIIALFDFFVVNSRMATIIIFVLPVFVILFQRLHRKKPGRFMKRLLSWICYVPVIALIITYIAARFYPSIPYLRAIDYLFGSRMYLNYSNLTRYGISLFGQSIVFNTGESIYNMFTGNYSTYNTVDNAYMCLLLQMGIIPMAIYIFANVCVIKKANRRSQYEIMAIAILICIYGLTESSIVNVLYNVPLIYLMSDYSDRTARIDIEK